MNQDYDSLYVELAAQTSDTPSVTLDRELRELHAQDPQLFAVKARETLRAHLAGRVHSIWPFLRSELRRITTTRETASTTADTAPQEQQLHLATRWVMNAGLYLSLPQAIDELFNDRKGRLRAWPDLQADITHLWVSQQPRVEQAEREAAEADERWRTSPRITRKPQQARATSKPPASRLDPTLTPHMLRQVLSDRGLPAPAGLTAAGAGSGQTHAHHHDLVFPDDDLIAA